MGCWGARWEEQRRDDDCRLLEDIWVGTGAKGEDAARGRSSAPHSQTVTRKRADGQQVKAFYLYSLPPLPRSPLGHLVKKQSAGVPGANTMISSSRYAPRYRDNRRNAEGPDSAGSGAGVRAGRRQVASRGGQHLGQLPARQSRSRSSSCCGAPSLHNALLRRRPPPRLEKTESLLNSSLIPVPAQRV